jgi:hypothetical protein
MLSITSRHDVPPATIDCEAPMSGSPSGSTLLDAPAPDPAREPTVTHRELAELQRTVATKATQLEQLTIDLDRLLGAAHGWSPPWVDLVDGRLLRSWRERHRADLRRLIDDLEDQARQLGDLRRHLLLPAAGEVARDPGRDER